MEQKLYKENVYKLFAITMSNAFIFAYVVERLFGLERGLSILEVQYIGIIYAVISLFLEVPCGVLADKWKKKYVLALGVFFCFFEFFISIYAHSFKMFALAFSLASVGGSLKSGTIESIMYQSLKGCNNTKDYEKYMGNLKFLKYVLQGFVGIVGGYTAHRYGLVTNYWLSLFKTPIAIALCLSIYEPSTAKATLKAVSNKTRPSKAIATTLKEVNTHILESIKVVKIHPGIGKVIVFSGIIGAVLYGQLHEMPSITYPDLGIPVYMFGYILLIILITGGLGGTIAGTIKGIYSYKFIFSSILLISMVAIYLFSLSTHWIGIAFLVIAIFTMEIISPLTSGYIHNRIEDKYRATISSMEKFVLQGLTIIVGLIFGYASNLFGIFAGFKAMSLILAIYGTYFILSWKEEVQEQHKEKVA